MDLKTKLPVRFENAITKLYNAFHNNNLNATSCTRCAVGNICGNKANWSDVFGCGNTSQFDKEEFKSAYKTHKKYYGKRFNKGLEVIDKTGYSPFELFNIECVFMNTIGEFKETKENQFKGLCAVIEYLCELDNIPNIMDYTSLFEYEDNKPLKELTL